MKKTWALIQAGFVVELTDIDPTDRFHPDFLWVDADGDVMIGDAYVDGAIVRPEPKPELMRTRFSVREFVRRFTMEEQLAVRQTQLTDMEVGLVYDDFNRAEFIDIEDADVVAGIDLYIGKGLLAASRRGELLAPEPISAA